MRVAMNLQKLRALHAIMETKSVTLAADRMLLTQPAVSRSLQSLEEELGFKLFVRRNGKLIPTAQGEVFYKESERLLNAINELPSLAKEIRGHKGVRLRIRTMPELSRGILAPVVRSLADDFPSIRFSIELRQRRDIERWASRLHFDIGLAMLPLSLDGITTCPFAAISAVAIVPPGHRLASHETLSVRDIAKEPIVALSRSTLLRQVIDGMFVAEGEMPDIVAETSSSEMLCQLVGQGMGVAIVDAFTAQHFSKGVVEARAWSSEIQLLYGFIAPDEELDSPIVEEFKLRVVEETRSFCERHAFVDGVASHDQNDAFAAVLADSVERATQYSATP